MLLSFFTDIIWIMVIAVARFILWPLLALLDRWKDRKRARCECPREIGGIAMSRALKQACYAVRALVLIPAMIVMGAALYVYDRLIRR